MEDYCLLIVLFALLGKIQLLQYCESVGLALESKKREEIKRETS